MSEEKQDGASLLPADPSAAVQTEPLPKFFQTICPDDGVICGCDPPDPGCVRESTRCQEIIEQRCYVGPGSADASCDP